VDLQSGVIRIEQTVQRIKIFEENSLTKTKLVFSEPKTKSGNRSIPLPARVLTELRSHKKRQLEEKLAAEEIWEESGLVFTTELGGVVEPRNFLRKYYQLLKKAGLEHINFHTATRHTFATRLLEANEHPKVVQEMLGHASIVLTLDTYSHVLPEIKQAAAAKLDFLFQEKNPSVKEGF
jgi:integrase